MNKLKMLGAALSMAAVLGLATGCGNDLVSKVNKLADEACACKDMDCAKKVQEKMGKLAGADTKEPSDADKKKIMEAMGRMTECMTKLATGAAAAAGK